MENMGTWGF